MTAALKPRTWVDGGPVPATLKSRRWLDRAVFEVEDQLGDAFRVEGDTGDAAVVTYVENGSSVVAHLWQEGSKNAPVSDESLSTWLHWIARKFEKQATAEHFTEETRAKARPVADLLAEHVLDDEPAEPLSARVAAVTQPRPRPAAQPALQPMLAAPLDPRSLMAKLRVLMDVLERAGVEPLEVAGSDVRPERELGASLSTCEDFASVCTAAGVHTWVSDTKGATFHEFKVNIGGALVRHGCIRGVDSCFTL